MSIIKNRKKERLFVIFDRACVQDERLTWRARGLLQYLLSLPSDWVVNVRDLANRSPDGRDAVYSIIKELKKVGYIRYELHRNSNGKMLAGEYHVIEVPEDFIESVSASNSEEQSKTENESICNIQDITCLAEPESSKPHPEKPNTYIINNIQNKQNNKETAAAAPEVKNPYLVKAKQDSQTDVKQETKVKFSQQDIFINDKLTAYQQKRVDTLARELIDFIPYLNTEQTGEFAKQIADNLISQQNFIRCERKFHHKLSAIRKTILAGGWTPSIEGVGCGEVLEQGNSVEKLGLTAKIRIVDSCI